MVSAGSRMDVLEFAILLLQLKQRELGLSSKVGDVRATALSYQISIV